MLAMRRISSSVILSSSGLAATNLQMGRSAGGCADVSFEYTKDEAHRFLRFVKKKKGDKVWRIFVKLMVDLDENRVTLPAMVRRSALLFRGDRQCALGFNQFFFERKVRIPVAALPLRPFPRTQHKVLKVPKRERVTNSMESCGSTSSASSHVTHY